MKIVMPMVVAGMVVCFAAVASAGVISPTKVSAHVHKVKHQAYTWTTTGRITHPSKYCLPGTTSAVYCVPLTDAGVCTGKVSLTVKLGKDALLAASSKTIKRTTARVKSNCTYSIKTKFKTKLFTATHAFAPGTKGSKVKVSFSVRFLGNAVLNPKSARKQTVKAKVKSP